MAFTMKTTQTDLPLIPKVARTTDEINELKKLSTEKLIIWIVGRSQEMGVKLTLEELVLECWMINPEKTHPWVIARLGVADYPMAPRTLE